MLCAEFEDRLTDYLDGALAADVLRAMGEHALRCPVCHDLLNEVKNTIRACRTAEAPQPSVELEASILLHTAPETVMTCEEFEDYLTDYLDGFLPAALYHRWERHAALCECCTNLPGETNQTLPLAREHVGSTIRVVVTATNGVGSAQGSSTITSAVEGIAPTIVGNP